MSPTRVIRAVACFDFVVTAILAVPISAHLFVRLVYAAQAGLSVDPSGFDELDNVRENLKMGNADE